MLSPTRSTPSLRARGAAPHSRPHELPAHRALHVVRSRVAHHAVQIQHDRGRRVRRPRGEVPGIEVGKDNDRLKTNGSNRLRTSSQRSVLPARCKHHRRPSAMRSRRRQPSAVLRTRRATRLDLPPDPTRNRRRPGLKLTLNGGSRRTSPGPRGRPSRPAALAPGRCTSPRHPVAGGRKVAQAMVSRLW